MKFLFTKSAYSKTAILVIYLISTSVLSGEFDIKANINTTAYNYETTTGLDENVTSNRSLLLKPTISGVFTSKGLNASIAANYTSVSHQNVVENVNQDSNKSYTEYSYLSDIVVIENVMNIKLNGRQSYRTVTQNQSIVSDKILLSGELVKSERNNASLNFRTPNPKYLGLKLTSSYTKSESDNTLDLNDILNPSQFSYDNDNQSSSIQLYQGNASRGLKFNWTTNYNKTKRTSLDDFESYRHDASLGFKLVNNLNFVAIGSKDKYDAGTLPLTFNQSNLNTDSYGVGFNFNPSQNRKIQITYNDLNEGEDKNTKFIGLDTRWAFSERTKLSINISKKFYGRSHNFSFSHKIKNFSSSMSYDEKVTTFGSLNTETGSGLFVCTFGTVDISECFQPDTINYVLKAGEEYLDFNQLEADVSEQSIFRKNGKVALSYGMNKIRLSAIASYRKVTYLESGRTRLNNTISLNLNYKLSHKTNISLNASQGKDKENNDLFYDTNRNISIKVNRSLNKSLRLSLSARYLNRDSEDLTFGYFVTDKRLTLGLNYSFN